MVEKLSSCLSKHRNAAFAASGLALTVLAASQTGRFFSTSSQKQMLTDPDFDKNKLSYSEESENRAKQLTNVSYQMLISLGETEA